MSHTHGTGSLGPARATPKPPWLGMSLVLAAACSTPSPRPTSSKLPGVATLEPSDPEQATTGFMPYRTVAAQIIDAALTSDRGWHRLRHLTDKIGHRLSGSKSLERAISWARDELARDGHDNVGAEPVLVPHWVRGVEHATLLAPISRPLPVSALGGTVGTPKAGVTGSIVAVASFEELDQRAAEVDGNIVLFAADMNDAHDYDNVYKFRTLGAAKAARHGAVAVLVRSLTHRSLSTLHTGSMRYDDSGKKIPAAAITVEDSEFIERNLAAGERVEVRLVLGAEILAEAQSHNVIAELRGREKPEEIVVIGAHIDSWDIGQGAHDDGGGCVAAMEALRVLRHLKQVPRRTVRVVLWTNEENGLAGATQYANSHRSELPHHVAALELDNGIFAPQGISIENSSAGHRQLQDIVALLEPLEAARVKRGFSGADLTPLVKAGVPSMGMWVDNSDYFAYHHSAADTLDKVNPTDLQKNIAMMAIVAYVIADMPERFGPADPAKPLVE